MTAYEQGLVGVLHTQIAWFEQVSEIMSNEKSNWRPQFGTTESIVTSAGGLNPGNVPNQTPPPPPPAGIEPPPAPASFQEPRPISSRVTQSMPTGARDDREVPFWTILDAFRRRWIPAVAVGIPVALLVAGLLWQIVPAQYETTALLHVKQFESVVANNMMSPRSGFMNYRDSQINFLRTKTIADAALQQEGIKECRTLMNVKYASDFIQENVKVESDFADEYIKITMQGEYPEDIAAIVNAVKDAYLFRHNLAENKDQVDKLAILRDRFNEMDKNLNQNLDHIDRLAEELGTGSSRAAILAQEQLLNQVSALNRDIARVESEIRSEEVYRKYLKSQGLTDAQVEARMQARQVKNPVTQQALLSQSKDEKNPKAQLSRLLLDVRRQIDRFRRNVRDRRHPELVSLQRKERQLIAGLKQLANEDSPVAPKTSNGPRVNQSSYQRLLQERDQMKEEVASKEERLKLLADRTVELESQRDKLRPLMTKHEELQGTILDLDTELHRENRVTSRQDAEVPLKRNLKKRTQLSLAGGLGALLCVLGAFTLYEWMSYRVGSTSDIANAVNLRLVGTIPSPDRGGLLGMGIFAGKVDYDEWNRAVIESMDVVRTYLMRHIDTARSASILITSASANEGKTTVSCQLAASLARSGRRVVIVDCDFRRPSAHLMMDGKTDPGICEYLRGEATIKDICQETQANGLTFIAAGLVDQVVLQKLTSDGGRGMIEALKREFDFVVIDTSPMLFVAEPAILAQNADIVLLSTRKDYSRIPYVAQSRDSLRSLQVPLIGAVMVGADSDFQRQSYGYRQEIQKRVKKDRMASAGVS